MDTSWLAEKYDATVLPERVLQFGTGMLLRALSVRAVDLANRARTFNGRIVVVQSTASGVSDVINRQKGTFTLVELGAEHGNEVQRAVLVYAISRALVARTEWAKVRDVVASPELRVIVSNVTEAGFRLEEVEPPIDPIAATAPSSFPAKLVDLLYTRFERLPDGPPLLVIPTELVADNGPRLAAMVQRIADQVPRAAEFRSWLEQHVHFCSSLADRITTGAPPPELRAGLEKYLGYRDALMTVTEPQSFWAIEGDPDVIREAFPVDRASGGAVVFARDISFYRDRKLRILNGAHTAMAPLALLTGVRTVREAMEHPTLGALAEQILLKEIVPTLSGRMLDAPAYGAGVLDRFRNRWLEHEWRVIATNQTAKLRERVIPTIVEYAKVFGTIPAGMMLSLAGSLRLARELALSDGLGWWSDDAYRIVDVDRHLINRHWLGVDPDGAPGAISPSLLARFADNVLGDREIWGHDLRTIPDLVTAVTGALTTIQPRS